MFRSPFGFDSTADDVLSGVRLDGKRAVVTGATSGLGVETARALAAAGAHVALAVRRADAGARIAQDLRELTGNGAVDVGQLDLVDRTSVASFVDQWTGPLRYVRGAAPSLPRGAQPLSRQHGEDTGHEHRERLDEIA
jgi:NAD(P)-dependent dehydrogenase (short-subunit alcohol dehydrogenase family)